MRRTGLILALAVLSGPALAQRARGPAAAKPAVPAAPQQTTATFADWTLRCNHPEGAPPVCVVIQTISDKGRTFAFTEIGRSSRSDQLRLTVLVASNILITDPPKFQPGEREAPVDLTWRRCLPAGCLADATLSDEQLRRLRGLTVNGRITYKDGLNHDVAIPFAPKGLGSALDALARETG